MTRILRFAILLPVLIALAACGGSERAKVRYKARQDAVDPPQLWSIEVVPAPAGIHPIQICTDTRMRQGLARPGPMAGDQPCKPTGAPIDTPTSHVQRCSLNGEAWVSTATLTGDLQRDYTAALATSPLSDDTGGYRQTRRYRHLGPCPDGWAIGETTDQSGARVRRGLSALVQ
jgi:hypothetical protein